MSARIETPGLSVAAELYHLVNDEIAPGPGVEPDRFLAGFAKIIADLAPKTAC